MAGNNTRGNSPIIFLGIMLVVVIVAGILGYKAWKKHQAQAADDLLMTKGWVSSPEHPNPLPDASMPNGKRVVMTVDRVKEVLKDPASARFQVVVLEGSGSPVVCGLVNAKNGFGAYSGPSAFYFDSDATYPDNDKPETLAPPFALISDDDATNDAPAWKRYQDICAAATFPPV